ncbi:MAG: hypothetical protein J6I31_01235 [Prevotella sp.]|nr:hypothetical protein [Prevotella sp.]
MRKTLTVLLLLLLVGQRAWCDDVKFISCGWDRALEKVYQVEQTANAMPLSAMNMNGDWLGLENGWYYVDQNKSIKTLHIMGDNVHLILKDNTTLTCTGGVKIEEGRGLTIYSQSYGSKQGKLVATQSYDDAAGIGSAMNAEDANGNGIGMGVLVVHGGDISATGNGGGAGIGGGKNRGIGGYITIYGGKIDAKADPGEGSNCKGAAGIGGGFEGHQDGDITIYGGVVTAIGNGTGDDITGAGIGGGNLCTAGNIYIHGGEVNATASGMGAAAIGGGGHAGFRSIVITGGVVHAVARKSSRLGTAIIGTGAGIGAGSNAPDDQRGTITISNGVIMASSIEGAGIGVGKKTNGCTVNISGGMIVAMSERGAGIGSGNQGHGGTVNITGGQIMAVSTKDGAGIGGGNSGDGGTVVISGGVVAATGGFKNFNWFRDHGYTTAAASSNVKYGVGLDVVANFVLSMVLNGDYYGAGIGGGDGGKGGNVTITGGVVTAESGHQGAPGIGAGRKGGDNGSLHLGSDVLVCTGHSDRDCNYVTDNLVGHCQSDRYVFVSNSTVLFSAYDSHEDDLNYLGGKTMDAIFIHRKFYKGGQWNTLCAPFNVSNLEGTPLEGARLFRFDFGSELDKGTLRINLRECGENERYIEAGRPYFFKWNKPADYDSNRDAYDIEDPVFPDVKIINDVIKEERITGTTVDISAFGAWDYVPFPETDDRHIVLRGDTLPAPATRGLESLAFQCDFLTHGTLKYGTEVGCYQHVVLMEDGEMPEGLFNVQYVDHEWDASNKTLKTVYKKTPYIHGVIQYPNADAVETVSDSKWYLVDGDVLRKRLDVTGIAYLIIRDNATLTVTEGIRLEKNGELYIYTQSEDGGNLNGKLVVTQSVEGAAGIGGSMNQGLGRLVVQGGDISVKGGKYGAGIGTGMLQKIARTYPEIYQGTMEVYGGTINVEAGQYAAGIGGGRGMNNTGIKGLKYRQYGGTVTTTGSEMAAGLGGGGSYETVLPNYTRCGGSTGSVRIYGGTLTAQGGYRAAGIGSGNSGLEFWKKVNRPEDGNEIIIEGGTVTATGGPYGAGIGGGDNVPGCRISITGGTVKAKGGKYAAAIGGGNDALGGDIVVGGGTIEATAGDECRARDSKCGSAIGSGDDQSLKDNGEGNKLTINESQDIHVKVTAGDSKDNIERIFTAGERIDACHWRNFVRVEVCNEHDADKLSYVIVPIDATSDYHKGSCKYCNYEKVGNHVYDQADNSCVCGKKSNNSGRLFTIACYYPNPDSESHEYMTDSELLVASGIKITPKNPADIEGYIFKGWLKNPIVAPGKFIRLKDEVLIEPDTEVEITEETILYARYTSFAQEEWIWADDYQTATLKVTWADGSPAETFTVDDIDIAIGQEGYKKYIAHYTVTHNGTEHIFSNVVDGAISLVLKNDESNYEQIEEYKGFKLDQVTLSGRTFFKNNTWNTLCLPFSVNSLAGTPLEGADVRTLESSSYDGSTKTLTLNFSESGLTAIEAGKPYIFRWTTTSENAINPEFTNVTISKKNYIVTTDCVDFQGFFDPIQLEADDRTVLYMGSDNKLYWPAASFPVNACRAIFRLQNGLEADLVTQESGAPLIMMSFGDSEATSVSDAFGISRDAAAGATGWYTLNGTKVAEGDAAAERLPKGVYIHNGKKVVVK